MTQVGVADGEGGEGGVASATVVEDEEGFY